MSSLVERFAIGIDIGATKIASVLLSQEGKLIASSQVPTQAQEGAQAVLDRVANQIVDLARRKPGAVVGAGIGSPGKVDSNEGIVYDAVNLGWTEVILKEEIFNRVETLRNAMPVWIQKDTNLNALGEYYYGAMGHEVMDASASGLEEMARFYASHGVTAFLATPWTASILNALQLVEEMQGPIQGGARVAESTRHADMPHCEASGLLEFRDLAGFEEAASRDHVVPIYGDYQRDYEILAGVLGFEAKIF